MPRGGARPNSGGPRPNSGGARPGAGRKSKTTEEYQQSMRSLFEQVVTPQDWERVIRTALSRAQAGDATARQWLAPWIVGGVPQEIKVEQSGRIVVEVVDDDAYYANRAGAVAQAASETELRH